MNQSGIIWWARPKPIRSAAAFLTKALLGRVLLVGAKVGSTVQVNAPNGILTFRITKIE